jgi:hypothetical protein
MAEDFDRLDENDDSGDEAVGLDRLGIIPVLRLPPPPAHAAASHMSNRSIGLSRPLSGTGAGRSAAAPPPWQLHAHLTMPLLLLQARGVDIEEHGALIAYHLHPDLLDDVGRLSAGDYFVKYPSKTFGAPHRRYFAIGVVHFQEGTVAEPMLLWKVHRGSESLTDALPLAWLVGVTVGSDASPVLSKYHSAKYRDALIGPVHVDGARTMLPRRLSMTCWFLDRRTGTSYSVDLATTQVGTFELWSRCLRGLVGINSVEPLQADDASAALQPLSPQGNTTGGGGARSASGAMATPNETPVATARSAGRGEIAAAADDDGATSPSMRELLERAQASQWVNRYPELVAGPTGADQR